MHTFISLKNYDTRFIEIVCLFISSNHKHNTIYVGPQPNDYREKEQPNVIYKNKDKSLHIILLYLVYISSLSRYI